MTFSQISFFIFFYFLLVSFSLFLPIGAGVSNNAPTIIWNYHFLLDSFFSAYLGITMYVRHKITWGARDR